MVRIQVREKRASLLQRIRALRARRTRDLAAKLMLTRKYILQ